MTTKAPANSNSRCSDRSKEATGLSERLIEASGKRTVPERKSLLLFVQSTRPTPDHGRLERSLGGGPEHERVAVAAGEQLVPPRAGARGRRRLAQRGGGRGSERRDGSRRSV